MKLLTNRRFLQFLLISSSLLHLLYAQSITGPSFRKSIVQFALGNVIFSTSISFCLQISESKGRMIFLYFEFLKTLFAALMVVPYLGVYFALGLNVGFWFSDLNPLPRRIVTDLPILFFGPVFVFHMLILRANMKFVGTNLKTMFKFQG